MKCYRWVLLGAVMAYAAGAQAWAPATHAYLAELITGGRDPDIIYGSMMADFHGTLVGNERADHALKRLAHDKFELLEPSAFAMGLATHNSLWGGDYYAHLYYDKDAPLIYSTEKLRELTIEFGITMNEAEDSWEGVVEYLIRKAYGPELGKLIKESAEKSSHEEELVEAFAGPLAEKAGMTREEAEAAIRQAARSFQALVVSYGETLMKDDAFLDELAVKAMMGYLGYGREEAERYLEWACELTQDDYEAAMKDIADKIREKMVADPRYAPYCGLKPGPVPEGTE